MATIKDLIEKMEDELRPYVIPLSEASNEQIDGFNELSDVKWVLERMTLTDEQLDMLLYLPNPLYNIKAAWSDPSRDNQTIAEAVNDYLLSSAPEYRHGKLIDRARAEYEDYLDNIKKQSPDIIIEAAYQITMKKEFVSLIEELESERSIDILFSLDDPVNSLYHEWLDNDYSFLDDLRQTIDDLVDDTERDLESLYEYGGKLPDYIVERFESAAQADSDDELSGDLEP